MGAASGLARRAVLPGMLMFLVLGQLLSLDMSLTFYLTLSLAGFLLAQREAEQPGPWMLLAWVGAALGVLTKGLIAAAYRLRCSSCTACMRATSRPGVGCPFDGACPCFWRSPCPGTGWPRAGAEDFLQFFFVREHLARYLTPEADRQEPWWFFAAVFLVGSLPWTISALRVLGSGWRRGAGRFQPPAVSVDLGAVHRRVLLPLRFEAHALYFAWPCRRWRC